MQTVVAYGFRELGLHRVQLEVWSFNSPAVRAYKKAGSVDEGRRREAIWHDGRWYDEVLIGLVEADWIAARPQRL